MYTTTLENMSNDSKNQEIPPGLSLQNDSDQSKQNEKYTEHD